MGGRRHQSVKSPCHADELGVIGRLGAVEEGPDVGFGHVRPSRHGGHDIGLGRVGRQIQDG